MFVIVIAQMSTLPLAPLSYSIPLNGSYSGEDLLKEAIYEGPIQRMDFEDPHRVARNRLKATQLTISLLANGSYFPIILHAGVPLAIGNFISFYALDIWAVNDTLGDALGPKREREIELIARNSQGKLYKLSLTAGCVALSLLAVTPLALPVLDYDGDIRIPGMVTVFLGGSILPLRSIQLSVNRSIQMQKCILGETGKKIEAIRSEIVSLIENYQSAFEQLDMADKLEVVKKHQAILNNEEQDQVVKYLSEVLADVEKETVAAPVLSRREKFIALAKDTMQHVPGAFLAASLETALTLYTFDKAKHYITDDDFGAGIFTAITIGSGLYLNGKSIVMTTHRAACAIFKGLHGQVDKGLSDQLRLRLSVCLKALGLLINLGTIGSSLVIFGDFFKDNETKKNFFVITTAAAYFLLTATATLDIVDQIVSQIISQKGTPEEQQIVQLHQGLTKLKQLFEKSSLLDFSIFILNAPENIKTALLKKVNLSLGELEEHINKLKIRRSR